MILDLQKASMWKRISAWLLDVILLVIVATLMSLLLSVAFDYDSYVTQLDARYAVYEEQYGVRRDLTSEQIELLTPDQRSALESASQAIGQDEEANQAYSMIVQLMILITSLSLLFAHLLTEFLLPLLLRNGQTIGKKVFGIAVMRTNSVQVDGVCMFIRTILGKYTIETMIPVMMVLMLFIGAIGEIGLLILAAILVTNVIMIVATHENALIHDKLANTVAVDLASQMIFHSEADMIAYKQQIAARKAADNSY